MYTMFKIIYTFQPKILLHINYPPKKRYDHSYIRTVLIHVENQPPTACMRWCTGAYLPETQQVQDHEAALVRNEYCPSHLGS